MLSATMIGCSNDKKDVVVNNDEDVVVATSVEMCIRDSNIVEKFFNNNK